MRVTNILMQGPMVRAGQEGRKTQTRRLAWGKPKSAACIHCGVPHPGTLLDGCTFENRRPTRWLNMHRRFEEGGPGYRELAYVRENVRWSAEHDNYYWSADNRGVGIKTYADLRHWQGAKGPKRVNSIHLPRDASRLTLEITGTKLQRLQDISEDDARAEGVETDPSTLPVGGGEISRRRDFRFLWNDLHGPDAWDANPEVVALTFRWHNQNVDALLAERAAA